MTTLARTALDIAASGSADRVGELLDCALLEHQYDHAEMRELLEARRGCRAWRSSGKWWRLSATRVSSSARVPSAARATSSDPPGSPSRGSTRGSPRAR